MDEPVVQKKYKDRLFTFIFGSNRAWALSLYNAVNGTSYADPEELQFTTIQSVLYLGMHNDVSLIIDNQLALFEQQSSYNPNMPLRFLQYVGNLYEQYVKQHRLNKMGTKQIMLPVPSFIVLYNGRKEVPDKVILRLSDAFPEAMDADIEVRVHVLNINHGRNTDMLQTCEPLYEYAWIVDKVRENSNTMPLNLAIDSVIQSLPKDFELYPFLTVHRAEVLGMFLEEYDEEYTMNLFKEEGREEGREEGIGIGIDKGKVLFAIEMVKAQRLSISDAAYGLKISESEFLTLMSNHDEGKAVDGKTRKV